MGRTAIQMIKVWVLVGIVFCGIHFAGMENVQAAENPVIVTSCKLNSSGSKVTVKAKVKQKQKAMGKKLYLLNLNAHVSEKGTKSATPLASVKTKKGTITFKVKYKSSMLYQKFVVAYKTNGKYRIVSDARYITNPEVLATYKGKGPKTTSKKGLQVEDREDALDLGTQHAVINWTLNSLLNNQAVNKTEFVYKGKTYYLDADILKRNDEEVQAYNAAGAKVTIILLLPKDAASIGTKAMQFGGYSYTKFSSFKTTSKAGCETFEAIMTYLAQRYGTKENLVSGWILGNEVNSACVWNYGGGKSLGTYMANYARAFRICYNAVKSVSKYAKVYISLDNNWSRDMDNSGKNYFSSKATVDTFFEKIKAQGDISFQIAYHAYPQGMSDPVFWDDSQAVNSKNSAIINFKNIKVLTDYAKKNFGKDCTIMLSEQSFNSNKGDAVQAAAYAYAYYISEGNAMIESFIYGREFDHPEEMKEGYHWGLCNNNRAKRLVWNVFQYIDSKDSFKFTDPLLRYTDLKKWTKINGFKKSICSNMPSKRQQAVITEAETRSVTSVKLTWEKIRKADGYEIYRDGTKVGEVSGNASVTYIDEGLASGGTYQYQVRMYKEAPSKTDIAKRVRLRGELSAAVPVTVTAGQVEINKNNCEVDGNVIKVAWKKMEGVSGFEIYRSTEENGTYVSIGEVAGNKTSYKDKQTLSGVTYYYKVAAFVTVNETNYYGKMSKVWSGLANIQLTVSIVDGKVVLNWTQWQNIAKYRVYCTPASVSAYQRQKTLTGFTYSCTKYLDNDKVSQDFVVGEAYYFRVRAEYDDGTFSKYSNEVMLYINSPIGVTDAAPGGTTPEPKPEMPGTEVSGSETPGTEVSGSETPGTEVPGSETPGSEIPGSEVTDVYAPGTEQPGSETPGTGTADVYNPGASAVQQ